MPVPRLLVFDLDGTLIDSRIDLANSINAMLAHYGRLLQTRSRAISVREPEFWCAVLLRTPI